MFNNGHYFRLKVMMLPICNHFNLQNWQFGVSQTVEGTCLGPPLHVPLHVGREEAPVLPPHRWAAGAWRPRDWRRACRGGGGAGWPRKQHWGCSHHCCPVLPWPPVALPGGRWSCRRPGVWQPEEPKAVGRRASGNIEPAGWRAGLPGVPCCGTCIRVNCSNQLLGNREQIFLEGESELHRSRFAKWDEHLRAFELKEENASTCPQPPHRSAASPAAKA